MKVLFVSYDGMTDPLGESQVIPYLAGLTQFGHEFTILSCDKPQKYKANHKRIKKLLDQYKIKWISVPYTKKPPVLSTIKDFRKLKKLAGEIVRSENIDLVHCRAGIGALVGIHLKKKFEIKFLNDIRGFYADERVDGGMWNLKNPVFKIIYNFFKRKELEAIQIADYNVCLTYKAQSEILSWNNLQQPIDIQVVPCSVDTALFNKDNLELQKRKELQEKLGIEDEDFVFSYLGSLGGWYLTDEMLQLCGILYEKMPNAKFLFISNNDHEQVMLAAQKYNIPKEKVIVKFGQRNEVPLLLSFSRYSIFFIKPCYSKLSSSPTKHGEIMALGIPVITNAGVGDVKEIVEKYQSGYVLDELNANAFINLADRIASQKEKFDPIKIRNGALEFYNLESSILKYKTIYSRITNN